jgi:Zn-dependent peptidase ImmA (M78 family)/DNA-binding XRE family transcriptional regulator
MGLSNSELGRRLQGVRDALGLSQEVVAGGLGVARSAVAEIESGRRRVSGLELDRLARMYGRSVEELLADGAATDPVAMVMRATADVKERAFEERLRRAWRLCEEVRRLERELEVPSRDGEVFAYEIAAPRGKYEAIVQGRRVAESERRRLDLGSSPVWELPEILLAQGVRVTEEVLPEGVSGALLFARGVGALVVVNELEHRVRRLFSYAHEYAHALLDRGRGATVSRYAEQGELIEVRANVFAAHFLMPADGVAAYLASLGKGDMGRQVQLVAANDDVDAVEVPKRRPTASQEVQVHDVVQLAHYFGVSYTAALHQLLNLKALTQDRFEALRGQERSARSVMRTLRGVAMNEDVHWRLSSQVLSVGLEAFRREIVSRRKFVELAAEAGVDAGVVDELLTDAGLASDALGPEVPE